MKRNVSGPALALVKALAAFVVTSVAGIGGATQFENRDANCASCHTQPETNYVGRAQATSAHPVDLASAHAQGYAPAPVTRCIDCHSGAGLIGRLGAISLGARDALSWATNTARQPAITTVQLPDVNCLKCHTDTPGDVSFDRHFHRTLLRWQQANLAATGGCVTCHTAHSTDGNFNIGHLQQQRMRAVCDQCHIDLGVAEP